LYSIRSNLRLSISDFWLRSLLFPFDIFDYLYCMQVLYANSTFSELLYFCCDSRIPQTADVNGWYIVHKECNNTGAKNRKLRKVGSSCHIFPSVYQAWHEGYITIFSYFLFQINKITNMRPLAVANLLAFAL